MPLGMDDADFSVWPQHAVLVHEWLLIRQRPFEHLSHGASVVGMNGLHVIVVRGRIRRCIDAKNFVQLVRPPDAILWYVPLPTPNVDDALCIREAAFAY